MPRGVPSATKPGDALVRLRRHRYGSLAAVLASEPSLLVKPMFGCLACYVHGRLMLVLADRRPPWRGVLVPTRREHHAALRAELRALAVHPVLAKWLHVRESAADFESVVGRLVVLAASDDPRLGVEPTVRTRRGSRAS